jgi:hypothetical protein
VEKQKAWGNPLSGRLGQLMVIIVLERRLAGRVLRYETSGVQALAPMVTGGA